MNIKNHEKNINPVSQSYLKTGIQYGHKSKEWNPKMAPYLLGEKYGSHFFDLTKTAKFLRLAGDIVEKKAQEGKNILFVGTNNTFSNLIASHANQAQVFYINYRWLGGMLTNWTTLQKRVQALDTLESQNLQGAFEEYPKKIANQKRKTLAKLQRFFGGIRNLKSLPSLVIFTTQLKESSAILECQKLGICTICIIDTNCNPDLSPYCIPANDDAPGAIDFILKYLVQRIQKAEKRFEPSLQKSTKTSTFSYKPFLLKDKFLIKKN